MRSSWRMVDWPMRTKMAALLVCASLLPLAIWAYADLQQDRSRLLAGEQALLKARAEQIARELDAFNRGYQRAVDGITRFPDVAAHCGGDDAQRAASREALRGTLAAYPASDPGIGVAGLVDGGGVVMLATERRLDDTDLADRTIVRTVLQSRHAATSDPFISLPSKGSMPTVAYMAPRLGADGRVACIAALWLRAAALWAAVKSSAALVGPGSYAVVLDREGIRIAHTDSDEIVFHPTGTLDAATLERLVAERRFGERTRELLTDVRPFPEMLSRARAPTVDDGVFVGMSAVRGAASHGVARRLETVPWTVFYMVPSNVIDAEVAQATRGRLQLAALVMAGAGLVGAAFAGTILRPVERLRAAAARIAAGDLGARVGDARRDELGALGRSFDAMAGRIEAQTAELQRARDDLEQRVRERTAALHRAQVLTRLGHVVTAPDGTFESWSETLPAMAGLDDATMPRSTGAWLALVHPEDRQRLRDTAIAAAATRDRQAVDYRLRRSDGGYVHIHQVIEPIPGSQTVDGRMRWFSTLQDVTQQRNDEEALRAGEERTRLIVDTALDAVVTMDASGRISGWNPHAEATFGWTRDEAIGRPLAETIIPPQYREAHRRGLAAYLATGTATVLGRRVELSAMHRDGHEFPVDLSITPLAGRTGLAFSAFVRDISERKHGEARLAAQLERLLLLDQITRAVGERQDLQSIYQVAVRSVEEQLPVDFACVCHHDAASDTLTLIRVGAHGLPPALAEQSQFAIDENGLARCMRGELVYEPDIAGSRFDFPRRLAAAGLRALVIAPLQSEGRVFGAFVAARRRAESFSSADCEFLRQLSAHVALAARQAELHGALQEAYDELRATQHVVMQQERLRALGQMASGIAHDINNAIAPVALYAESLLEREPNLSERGRGYLETISRAIDDVAATVARMREFYRPRDAQPPAAAVHLGTLAQQVADLTRARWSDMPQRRGVVVELRLELAEALPAVPGVESELREALINLVLNAVDAMPDGGVLALRTRSEAGRVVVEVADTGIGMDEPTRRRCLEPFFTTKGERGSGLGLAMVYGIAQRHGADVEIDSALGAGTSVRLVFPLPAVAPEPAAPAVVAVPTRLRLLVVDDDPLLLQSLRETLEVDGHRVVTASGGRAGIDALAPGRFDAVITDLGMPYVDGRQVAAAVKSVDPALPVVMLTGWGQRLLNDGEPPPHVDRLLSKPPKLRELRVALAQLVPNGGASP